MPARRSLNGPEGRGEYAQKSRFCLSLSRDSRVCTSIIASVAISSFAGITAPPVVNNRANQRNRLRFTTLVSLSHRRRWFPSGLDRIQDRFLCHRHLFFPLHKASAHCRFREVAEATGWIRPASLSLSPVDSLPERPVILLRDCSDDQGSRMQACKSFLINSPTLGTE